MDYIGYVTGIVIEILFFRMNFVYCIYLYPSLLNPTVNGHLKTFVPKNSIFPCTLENIIAQ